MEKVSPKESIHSTLITTFGLVNNEYSGAFVNTIYFWSDTVKGLSEIKRVLRDKGIFYNAVYTRDWMRKTSYTQEGFKLFDKEEYVEMAKAAGFKDVKIVDIIAGTNFLVICKK